MKISYLKNTYRKLEGSGKAGYCPIHSLANFPHLSGQNYRQKIIERENRNRTYKPGLPVLHPVPLCPLLLQKGFNISITAPLFQMIRTHCLKMRSTFSVATLAHPDRLKAPSSIRTWALRDRTMIASQRRTFYGTLGENMLKGWPWNQSKGDRNPPHRRGSDVRCQLCQTCADQL